jgi:hypothetical protein
MKRVLLLGDSIRMSYQPLVKAALTNRAEVVGPQDNCRFAKYTLWNLGAWFQELGHPDVIHWNNGIWDVYHLNADVGVFTPPDEYMRDLRRVFMELRKTGAQIIWAKTTPVDPRFVPCNNPEIDLYNALATDFLVSQGIPVNDLNAVVRQDLASYIGDDFLHLSPAGQDACARAVVAAVSPFLDD